MELATRTWGDEKLAVQLLSLHRGNFDISLEEYGSVWGIKGKGNRPFDYPRNCRVFNERPIGKDIIDYCVYLPRLFE